MEFNTRQFKGKLPIPLLAVGGEHSIPTMGDALRPCFGDVTAVVIANSGHFVPEEQPEALAMSLLAFLRRDAQNMNPGGAMTERTRYETDIRPLFTERDIQAMRRAFNLASYDDVKTHSVAIYDRIRGIGGAVMPPPPRGDGPWPQSRIDLFGKWIADGRQP